MPNHTPRWWRYGDSMIVTATGETVAEYVLLDPDGCLMAAAPELRAACEHALVVLTEGVIPATLKDRAEILAAQAEIGAALKKADGQ